jgi:hypothetical protein
MDGNSRWISQIHERNTQHNCRPKDTVFKATKAIYVLVQAARQWWKKFKEVLSELGFKPSRADTLLFIKNQDGCKKSLLRFQLFLYVCVNYL